jgi:hypothetical protein
VVESASALVICPCRVFPSLSISHGRTNFEAGLSYSFVAAERPAAVLSSLGLKPVAGLLEQQRSVLSGIMTVVLVANVTVISGGLEPAQYSFDGDVAQPEIP